MKRGRRKGWITAAVLLPAGLLLFAVLAITAWGVVQGQAAGAPTAVDNGPSILVTAGPVVDNSQYSYLALVCMEGTGTSSTLRLYVLAVRYSSKTYVPFIVNET